MDRRQKQLPLKGRGSERSDGSGHHHSPSTFGALLAAVGQVATAPSDSCRRAGLQRVDWYRFVRAASLA
jgi:hypothetical protein